MKKVARFFSVFIICSFICILSFTAFAENTAYEIDELKMSITIPDDMLAVTRNSEKTDEYFTKFGLDYNNTMSNLQKGNIYLQAIKEDSSLTLTASMTQTDDSMKIDNYNKLTEDGLNAVKEKLLENNTYKSGSIVEYNGTKYISLFVSTKSGKKIIQAQQYNTVVNGSNIVITFQAAAGKKITSDDRELFVSMLEETTITEDNFFTQNRDLIIYGGATLIGLIIVAIVLILLIRHFKNPARKNKNLIHELAHEHRITETTKFPKKRIQDIIQHTSSFMTNYAPVEEVSKRKSNVAADNAKNAIEISESGPESNQQSGAEKTAEQIEAAKQAVQANEENSTSVQQDKVSPEQHNNSRELEETLTEEAENDAAQSEENFNGAADYFDHVPDKEEMYSYSNVDTAVDDYNKAKINARKMRSASQEKKGSSKKVKKVLLSIGLGIVNVLQGIWMIICFIVIHCKYFCINLSRLIKRKYARRKQRKIQEEKRREEMERRRIQREAEMRRRRQNSNRGANDLVKVRSSAERGPVRRSEYSNTRRPQARPGSTSHSSKRY